MNYFLKGSSWIIVCYKKERVMIWFQDMVEAYEGKYWRKSNENFEREIAVVSHSYFMRQACCGVVVKEWVKLFN